MKLKLDDEPRLNTEDRPASHRPMKARARKIVVVVDDSPESKVALRFAAGRAAHLDGGELILFHCIRPGEFSHWVAVADRMREEAHEEAAEMMNQVAERMHAYCGVQGRSHIVEGEPHEELAKFMTEEEDLFFLFLGANTEGEPGPLVDYFSGPLVGSFKCPVGIVPGSMSREEIDEMV